MGTQSCLYEGFVWHHRRTPVAHEFRYRLFMVYVDLAELGTLFGRRGVWSTRPFALARFRRADHLGDSFRPLADCVRRLVEQELGWAPEGPIGLLTHFRYSGIRMNPVSFYYCFAADGTTLEAVVAEVTNTPWGEQHCYVADVRGRERAKMFSVENEKEFHVSPFLPMDLHYRWHFSAPTERLSLQIEVSDDQEAVFAATLSLSRRPLTRWQLARALLRYPLMTAQVWAGIYWQAFRLWRKGVPYVPHPGKVIRRSKRQIEMEFAQSGVEPAQSLALRNSEST